MKITSDEVHIWFYNLKDKTNNNILAGLLSQDEHDRSCRFAFPYLKNRFVLVRATLRLILSQYIQESANKIRFFYGKYGKPHLYQENEIKFNLSHSGDCAVFAISFKDEIGIDLEEVRKDIYSLDMEKICLSEREQGCLINLPFEERMQSFYTLWACKEAVLKGLGCGLVYPIHELEVDISNAFPKIKNDTLKDWALYLFPSPHNFKGALAVESEQKKFVFREWQGVTDRVLSKFSLPLKLEKA